MKKYLAAVSALLVSGSLLAAPVATIVEETASSVTVTEASAPAGGTIQAASSVETQTASQVLTQ